MDLQAGTAPPARRPRNRRRLIVDAAGRVFNERGYHATSMEEIAHRVGITGPALYRHFPNKYALFAECASFMVDGLLAAVADLPDDADLEQRLVAVTRETIAHRASGGVYRWEARYLEADDRRALRDKFERLVEHFTSHVPAGPADLPADLRAAAALGAIGSITMHRTRISAPRAEDVLVAAAMQVAQARDLPGLPTEPAAAPGPDAPDTRRAQILSAAIALFAREGFHQVTLGQVAQEVGIVTSAIYRHFPAKVDILAAACVQAAGVLSDAVDRALDQHRDPRDAVAALASTYVAYSFEHRAMTSVAEAEIVGLPPELQRPLVAAQREHVAVWKQHLRAARPDLDDGQAAVLVHAGFGVVVEGGRRLHWRDSDESRRALAGLVVSALGLAG